MQSVQTTANALLNLRAARAAGQRIALIPTMGALHDGHLSLAELAKQHAQYAVMSIFVNPLQFNAAEDLEKYPRTLESDLAKAAAAGVDLVFVPEIAEIYPSAAQDATKVVAGSSAIGLCGAARPGHFDGVVKVVSILFNIIRPDAAVFGEKDYQQLKVIEQLVRDLHYQIEIIPGALIRDSDGLALSSRNVRLSAAERKSALAIPRALFSAAQLVKKGETSAQKIKNHVREIISESGMLRIDYVESVDPQNLKPLKLVDGPTRLLIAVYCGDVRLIDNIQLR